MKYPPHLLDQIRARLSLVEEVRRVVPSLKKKGRTWSACCPFHNEKTPSFHVRDEAGKSNYHCFGCAAAGDIFSFVMETQGSDFPHTVQDLARKAGVALPTYEKADPEAQSRREKGLQALSRAADFWQKNLETATPTSLLGQYLQRRGLSPATIAEFQLGYSPDDWNASRDALQQEGFAAEILRETGLCIASDKGRGDYDRFRGRLMFPIHDLQSRVVGFGGRILDKGEPKYLNSPETPFFTKSFLLYNLHRARPEMKKRQQAILVEGYMDVIALWQAGLKTAVAPMGTAVTEDQFALLWQQVGTPIVCLDGDAAGRNAAIRLAQKLLPALQPGRGVQFVHLPDGEDPDSLIKKDGLTAFHTLLSQPTSLEDVLWQHVSAGQDLTQADARASVDGALNSLMATIRDVTVRRAYSQTLRDRLWQATRTARGQATATASGKKLSPAAEEARQRSLTMAPASYHPAPVTDAALRYLVALVIRWPALLPDVAEPLGCLLVPTGELADILHALLRGFTRGQAPETLIESLHAGLLGAPLAELLRTTGVNTLPEEPLNTMRDDFFARLTAWQARQGAKSQRQLLLNELRRGVFNEQNWQQIRQLARSTSSETSPPAILPETTGKNSGKSS